jgi:hypothetical protein
MLTSDVTCIFGSRCVGNAISVTVWWQKTLRNTNFSCHFLLSVPDIIKINLFPLWYQKKMYNLCRVISNSVRTSPGAGMNSFPGHIFSTLTPLYMSPWTHHHWQNSPFWATDFLRRFCHICRAFTSWDFATIFFFTRQGHQPCVQLPTRRTRSLYLCPSSKVAQLYSRHRVHFSSPSTNRWATVKVLYPPSPVHLILTPVPDYLNNH